MTRTNEIEWLADKFYNRRSYFKLGNGKIASVFNVSRDNVIIAKRLAADRIAQESAEERHERNILFIPDLHIPFEEKGALDFCKSVYEEEGCNEVIFGGDLVDHHFMSFHDTDPDGLSARDEHELAKEKLTEWADEFPEASVLRGNHDCYDAQTQCLTRDGWKNGDELTMDDEIGTMNRITGVMEFQKPTKLFVGQYKGEMFRYKNSTSSVDLLVTPNHRMVYLPKDNKASDNSNYHIERAYRMTKGSKYFPISCINNNEGIDLSDELISLAAWIYTDRDSQISVKTIYDLVI
jgi:hypothetical protein